MVRGAFIIAFAIAIDALQGLFALFFTVMQFITPAGGGFTGAIAAGYYCWKISDGILSGIANATACATAGGAIGAGVSAFAVPIGAAVDIGLSIALGGALIAALAFMGMFYPGIVIGSFIGETLPFLDAIIPGWTYMAIQCVRRHHAKEKALRGTQPEQTQAVAQSVAVRERLWEDIRTRSTAPSYAEQTA